MRLAALLKRPSAFLPVLMSLGALATVAIALAILGTQGIHQPDEGTAAHVWQLLMAGQLPIVAVFAAKWLPREPKSAVAVLVLQAVAGIAALSPVFLLRL